MSNSSNSPTTIEIVSGSAITQLAQPHPEERLRKARLMYVINDVLKRKGLSQTDAAMHLGIDQADISRLAHGRGGRFSTDRLLDILAKLDVDVELTQRHDADGNLVVEVHELARA